MSASTSEHQVTGMTCGHCEMSIHEETSSIPEAQDFQVSGGYRAVRA